MLRAYTICMRRVMTALVLAGAITLVAPRFIFAQHGGGGGHAGGFSGGHVGGFSGGGFSGPRFGGPSGGFSGPRFAAPSSGFGARSFPAPRMNMMPRPLPPGAARFAPNVRPYGGWTWSPSGQSNNPAVRRSPYPVGNRGWANQPYHPGNWQGGNNWHGGGHDGHHYRQPYYGGLSVYPYPWPYYWWPYYSYGWNWPWIPYLGGWDSQDYYTPDQNASPDQYQNQYPYQYPYPYPYQNPDQYSAPEPPPDPEPDPVQGNAARPAYEPALAASPAVAIAEPTVTIVYKDGHAEQVRNFALTRTTLLMMDNAAAGFVLSVPLELVDLPATQQANRATGVDFRLPVRNSLHPVSASRE
jgi:hypothetical protein